jgi:hypothetical protein
MEGRINFFLLFCSVLFSVCFGLFSVKTSKFRLKYAVGFKFLCLIQIWTEYLDNDL